MREDVLSKRIFYAGCLGLPWLWVVHVLYVRQQQQQQAEEEEDTTAGTLDNNHNHALLRGENSTSSEDADPTSPLQQPNTTSTTNDATTTADTSTAGTTTCNKALLQKYRQQCWYGALSVFGLWTAWIVVFHVMADRFDPKWFVRDDTDTAEVTGW